MVAIFCTNPASASEPSANFYNSQPACCSVALFFKLFFGPQNPLLEGYDNNLNLIHLLHSLSHSKERPLKALGVNTVQ